MKFELIMPEKKQRIKKFFFKKFIQEFNVALIYVWFFTYIFLQSSKEDEEHGYTRVKTYSVRKLVKITLDFE